MTDGPRDYWTPDGAFFVCDGWKYGIAPDGSTVCVGPVSKPPETPQDTKNSVSKIVHKENLPMKMSQTQKTGIMKHRGRPKKRGESVSRVTKWRRKKEKQGVLL